MLTAVTAAFIYFVAAFKPSISAFRIFIIGLGSTVIASVLICLTSGYIRSHSHRKLTFPVQSEPPLAQDSCAKALPPEEAFANCNLLGVVAIAE